MNKKIKNLIERGALFVINHSGGKDSQCMTIKLKRIIQEKNILIIHSHLPGVEWSGTISHIENTIGNKAFILTGSNTKTFFEMVDKRQNWPSPKQRQCTSDLKRGPIEREIRQYIKKHHLSGLVVNCMGMRKQESPKRAKMRPFKFNKRNSRGGREWYDWLPIHKLKTKDVFDTIKDAGQQPHWAYSRGMSRLSCCFCIMASRHDLRISREIHPKLYQLYVEKEKEIGKTIFMVKNKPVPLNDYLFMEESVRRNR